MPSAGTPPPVQTLDEDLSQTRKGPVSKVLSSLEGEAGPVPRGRCFTHKSWVFMPLSPTAPPPRPQCQCTLYVTCMGEPHGSWGLLVLLRPSAPQTGRTRLRGHWHTAQDESHTFTHLYSFQPSVSVFFFRCSTGFFWSWQGRSVSISSERAPWERSRVLKLLPCASLNWKEQRAMLLELS